MSDSSRETTERLRFVEAVQLHVATASYVGMVAGVVLGLWGSVSYLQRGGAELLWEGEGFTFLGGLVICGPVVLLYHALFALGGAVSVSVALSIAALLVGGVLRGRTQSRKSLTWFYACVVAGAVLVFGTKAVLQGDWKPHPLDGVFWGMVGVWFGARRWLQTKRRGVLLTGVLTGLLLLLLYWALWHWWEARPAPDSGREAGEILAGIRVAGVGKAPLGVPGGSIVLIVVDALRPDCLGCYGGDAHTPNIDSLAKNGFLFEQCFANAPWTAPSMASLLTSHHPSLCTEGEGFQFLASGVPTLAEGMRSTFRTAWGVVSSPWLKKEFGFGRGFDEYDYIGGGKEGKASAGIVTEAALRRLRDLGKAESFFLLVHYIDPHMPFGPSGKRDESARERELRRVGSPESAVDARSLTDDDREYVRGLYRASVEEVDRQVGRLLRCLDGLGAKWATAVVVTADHGEEFWEHGGVGHGNSYYDEVLHVPLILYVPGVEGGTRVSEQVRLLDVAPTLLELAEATMAPEMEGRSLLPLLGPGSRKHLPLYAEGARGKPTSRCVRTEGLKVIYDAISGEGEVYDLVADPGEREDLIASPPGVAAEALGDLRAWSRLMESIRAGKRGKEARRLVPGTTLEELRSLGYVNPGRRQQGKAASDRGR